MDSQAPNKAVAKWLSGRDYDFVKPEFFFGKSRIDFYMEKGRKKFLLEVKGCTLEFDGLCKFPDAPTECGVRHLYELISAKGQGYDADVLFLVQMEGAKDFSPNDETNKAFGDAIRLAKKKGVKILCYGCTVKPDFLVIKDEVKVIL